MSLHVIQRPNDLGNKKALNVAECIMWLYAHFRVLGVINISQNGIKGNFLRLEISSETQARKKHINIHHSLRNPCGLS
jgi:hydrogenase maturation factor